MSSDRVHKIHNYYVGKAIAKGSFCTLYEGYHKEGFRPVAVRLISKRRLSGDPQADRILFNEKVLIRLLSHPHISPVLEVIESAAQLFHVMKFYARGDLSFYLSHSSASRAERLRLFDEVLSAVEYLHSLRIAHLDLKPENVLVNDAGQAQLIDFSFATFAFAPLTDQTCGSVGYVAPEVLSRCKRFDGMAADVFSLGIFLYAIFKGEPPFTDTRRFRSSRVDYQGIDEDIAGLIAAMITEVPGARPTVGQVRGHQVFSELLERCPSAKQLNVDAPVLEINEAILNRLADAMETDTDRVACKLVLYGPSREKVLYALAADCPDFRSDDVAVGSEKLRFSKSLPQQTSLSAICPICVEDFWVREVEGKPAVVASTITRKMLAQRFVVSLTRSGSREFVLNKADEDISFDVDICPGAAPGNSVVMMRGKDGEGSPVLGDLRDFLENQFPVHG